ncbi:UNVERIFIED_CONTAM: hypothetical protein GTU68_009784 [Idotea baltica]|nr:hypothetical protein [Idotea baltica]
MPDISEKIIDQVRNANDKRIALNIIGRGSKSFYGRTATGKTLNVAGHSGIVSYEASELVLTARAGTALSEIKSVLSEHNQVLSFDPPYYDDEGSLGGTLACNQSGPSRPWSGSVRDMVLGVRLINGAGQNLRFGGQVMKNVAGFDVARLQAGAMGSLGVITEISLKVMPKPAHSATLVCEIDTAADALTAMNHYRHHATPISGACWHQGKFYLRLSGAHGAVESAGIEFSKRYASAKLLDAEHKFWQKLRDQALDFFAGSSPLWRFSMKASAPLASMNDECLIDWGGAQRWLRSEKNSEELLNELPNGNGQISLFRHGDRTADVFHQPSSVAIKLHQQLKHSFDANGIFNSGRLYSWL